MSKEFIESVNASPSEHHTAGPLEKFANDYWSGLSKVKPATAIEAITAITSPLAIIEVKKYDPEAEYAKNHLTKAEYEQYERESSLLYKIGYYLTGKPEKDEFPMHDRVKHDMAEEAKHDLNKDDQVAAVMFGKDNAKYKEYQKEKEQIDKFKKEHPEQDLDMSKYPAHKLVEDVIASTKPAVLVFDNIDWVRTKPHFRPELTMESLKY